MSKFETVKAHVRDHKSVYIAAGTGFVVGAAVVFIAKNPKIIQTATTYGDNSPIIQIAQPVRRGHPGLMVQVKETGEVFASMRRAQEVLGVSHKKVQDLVDIIGEAK